MKFLGFVEQLWNLGLSDISVSEAVDTVVNSSGVALQAGLVVRGNQLPAVEVARRYLEVRTPVESGVYVDVVGNLDGGQAGLVEDRRLMEAVDPQFVVPLQYRLGWDDLDLFWREFERARQISAVELVTQSFGFPWHPDSLKAVLAVQDGQGVAHLAMVAPSSDVPPHVVAQLFHASEHARLALTIVGPAPPPLTIQEAYGVRIGWLNLLLGLDLAENGGSLYDVETLLGERNASAFDMSRDGVVWRGQQLVDYADGEGGMFEGMDCAAVRDLYSDLVSVGLEMPAR
jgi:hypothetical protein